MPTGQATPEQTIAERLAAVPEGKLLIRHADAVQPVLLAHHLAAGFPDGGKGCIRQLLL